MGGAPWEPFAALTPADQAWHIVLAAAAGLQGIAAEAGMTLVVDRAEIIRAADLAGLVVVGVAAP